MSSKVLLLLITTSFIGCGHKTYPKAPRGTELKSIPDKYMVKIKKEKKKKDNEEEKKK